MFEKRVIYLSYMKDEVKVKSAGYIRIEIRDEEFFMDMHVKAKGVADRGKYEILADADGGTVLVGMIYLEGGIGRFQEKFSIGEIGLKGKGLSYQDIEEFRIPLGEGVYIYGRMAAGERKERGEVHAAIDQPVIDQKATGQSVVRAEVQASDARRDYGACDDGYRDSFESEQGENAWGSFASEREGSIREGFASERGGTRGGFASERGGGTRGGFASAHGSKSPRSFAQAHDEDVRKKLEEVRMTPDKWQQLLKSYKQVHPYGDDRLYISIEPKDFVVMSAEYQHLAHNSFLLHGFYNYRHIILGLENESFYMGVPGVFYEREKMVAMMFGFEAFECQGGMAENGKFGYYLKKVKI